MIKLNLKIYPIEAILSACYAFIDRAYIFLDRDRKGDFIKIAIKGKSALSERKLTALRGEFMNELLHCALRYQISKNNKRIREYIIGRALYSSLAPGGSNAEGKMDFQKDPLGIATPLKNPKRRGNALIKT
jgi:His-Xaa-Ser system protein HxsD